MKALMFPALVAVGLICGSVGLAADGLIGHWKLAENGKDASGKMRHAVANDVRFDGPAISEAETSAVFNGKSSTLLVPSERSLRLGTGDFTVSLWIDTDEALVDLPGELLSQYNAETRTGFRLGLDSRSGVTTSQANTRNLHFGIDAGTEPGKWTDHGRLGNAILIFALTVYKGELFAGTCEAGTEERGRVFRYDGEKWHECGEVDACNSVSSLAVHDGRLYAGTSKYRLRGSSLSESENPHNGGGIYRYEEDGSWTPCGRLPNVEAINGLVSFGGDLYADSLYAPASFFRYAGGTNWTALEIPDGKRVESLAVHDGHIYATGYDEGAVYRFDGRTWEDLGVLDGATQTYGFATYGSELYVSEWPHAMVYRHGGGQVWHSAGRLGEELESMPLAVYNGKMYGGTLPTGEVYRYDGPVFPNQSDAPPSWTRVARLDHTPDVRYRRVWSMAVYNGRLFAGTLPSGSVHSVEIGRNVTHDHELPPGRHHIAAIRDGGHLKLYVDGEQVAQSREFSPSDYDLTNSEPLRIGHGTTDHFLGRMGDLRIYNTALSAGEVRSLSKMP